MSDSIVQGMRKLKKVTDLIEVIKASVTEHFDTLLRGVAISVEYGDQKYTVEIRDEYKTAESSMVTEFLYQSFSAFVKAVCLLASNTICTGADPERYVYLITVRKGEDEVMSLKAEAVHLSRLFFSCEKLIGLVPCIDTGRRLVVLSNIESTYVNLEILQ